jgi:hypothetical protein|tara:strand:+ start:101 stop:262 length:162 start_codon:yes stop_codon:yes gene_type:complete
MNMTMIYLLLACAPIVLMLIHLGFKDIGWKVLIPVGIITWLIVFVIMAAKAAN